MKKTIIDIEEIYKDVNEYKKWNNETYNKYVNIANFLAYQYYTLGNSIVADKTYDLIYDCIIYYEKHYNIIHENSPSKRVGDIILEGFETITHRTPMLSLNKALNEEERTKWVKEAFEKFPELEFSAEPKYDGATGNLVYENGELVTAATRGNGTIGENVTENAKLIRGVPLHIPYKGFIEIRGEFVMFDDDFKKINENIRKQNELIQSNDLKDIEYVKKHKLKIKEELSNARNATSGALKSLDSSKVKEKMLRFCPFGIGDNELDLETVTEQYDWILSQGFTSFGTHKTHILKSFEELENFYNNFNNKRDNNGVLNGVLSDGMVVKINNLEIQEKLGYTAKHPRGAVAYKFPPVEVTTKLIKIIEQVGKESITPVGIVSEVNINGVNVNRVTLHNYDDIKNKDIKIGDTITIIRSGDVIPKIIKVHKDLRNGNEIEILPPSSCPSCGGQVVKGTNSDGSEAANYICLNEDCNGKLSAKLKSALGKKGLNIEGLGSSIIEQLVNNGKVKNLIDMYNINKDDLMELDLVKVRKANTVLKNLKASKGIELYRFIYALGIEQIGETASKKLVEAKGMESISGNLSYDDFLNIPDFGETSAQNLVDYLDKNMNFINELKAIINPSYEETILESNIFENKNFVITGTLSLGRDVFKKIIESHGGKVSGSVSKNTDYVLAGEKAGSKAEKAESLGVEILSEKDFNNLINKKEENFIIQEEQEIELN